MSNWKFIKGFDKKYKLWCNGTIYSCTRKRRMKWQKHTSGYWKVDLYKNGERITHLIHRLTGSHFVPNPNNYNVLNHIDEDKLNPHSKNLEWCDQQYNINYYYGQRKKKNKG